MFEWATGKMYICLITGCVDFGICSWDCAINYIWSFTVISHIFCVDTPTHNAMIGQFHAIQLMILIGQLECRLTNIINTLSSSFKIFGWYEMLVVCLDAGLVLWIVHLEYIAQFIKTKFRFWTSFSSVFLIHCRNGTCYLVFWQD
jgi:hypothetical protein